MKCFTQADVDELHYIPANHMFVTFMMSKDVDEHKKFYQGEAARMRKATTDGSETCLACMEALAKWYEESCRYLIGKHALGAQVDTSYPPCPFPLHPATPASGKP